MTPDTIQPFISAHVQPAFGVRRCWICHRVASGWEDGYILAARSATGTGDWEDIPGQHTPNTTIEDTESWQASGLQPVYYKLVLVHDKGTFVSPLISTFGLLSSREYTALRAILHQEHLIMRKGVEIRHVVPRRELPAGSIPPKTLDPDTLQPLSAEALRTAPDASSSGAAYGWHPALRSWMLPGQASRHGHNRGGDGSIPSPTTETMQARLLAFPDPASGHLIVCPADDRRYIITDNITPLRYRGTAALAYEATLQLLPRSDVRYLVPV